MLLERLYERSHGEETDDVSDVEALADMKREEVLETFAKYLRHIEHQRAAISLERKRLDEAEARLEPRKEWAEGELLKLLEAEGMTSTTTPSGFTIRSRAGSQYVHCDANLNLDELPPALVRWTKPIPPKPELDKKAAAEYLKQLESEPIPGLYLARKPRSVKVE